MKNLAIIPARGGSKRIPRKNIKDFLGKPIIAYSIEKAIQSGLFDEVMVSTDDNEIAEIAKSFGAKIPFMRSENTSSDFATLAEVVKETLQEYKILSFKFDNCCVILPTSPLLLSENIINAYKLITSNPEVESVNPIVKYEYPLQRALIIENNFVKMNNFDNYKERTQDFQTFYHDCGQFYFFKVQSFMKRDRIMSNKSVPLVLPSIQVQDIDNEEDWELAEFKYRYLNKKLGFD
jgi:N-acylneuraminate cytidylyltransferase